MRRLTLFHGGSHRERITRWVENECFELTVLDPPFFARSWVARISLGDRDDAVVLDWEMSYEPRFGVMGRILDRLVVAPALDLAFRISLGRLVRRLRAMPASGPGDREASARERGAPPGLEAG